MIWNLSVEWDLHDRARFANFAQTSKIHTYLSQQNQSKEREKKKETDTHTHTCCFSYDVKYFDAVSVLASQFHQFVEYPVIKRF